MITADLAITVQIARLIVGGMGPVEAVRTICGADKTDAMISALYDALRAKAVAA